MKDLIFKQSAKAFFIPADFLHDFTSREAACGRDNLILQENTDEHWRLYESVELRRMLRHKIAPRIRRASRPTIPVLSCAVDHCGFGVRIENGYLLFELFGQPHVIRIEECY